MEKEIQIKTEKPTVKTPAQIKAEARIARMMAEIKEYYRDNNGEDPESERMAVKFAFSKLINRECGLSASVRYFIVAKAVIFSQSESDAYRVRFAAADGSIREATITEVNKNGTIETAVAANGDTFKAKDMSDIELVM